MRSGRVAIVALICCTALWQHCTLATGRLTPRSTSHDQDQPSSPTQELPALPEGERAKSPSEDCADNLLCLFEASLDSMVALLPHPGEKPAAHPTFSAGLINTLHRLLI